MECRVQTEDEHAYQRKASKIRGRWKIIRCRNG